MSSSNLSLLVMIYNHINKFGCMKAYQTPVFMSTLLLLLFFFFFATKVTFGVYFFFFFFFFFLIRKFTCSKLNTLLLGNFMPLGHLLQSV